MKNYFLATLVALSMSSVLFSQDFTPIKKKTFDFGLRTGAHFYDISAKSNSINNTGLYVGVFAETQLSNTLALQLEANFSGFSILQLPVLLKYKLTDKFQIYGGAALDFSFEQKNLLESMRNKRFGASLIFGTQYYLTSKWFIEARYTHGLAKQIPFFPSFDSQPIFGKKQSFNLGIGYKF